MTRKKVWMAGLISFVILTLSFHLAFAHESVTVGDYTIEIGWVNEPPFVGQQKAIVVNILTSSAGKPVQDVSYGGQNKTLTLQALGEGSSPSQSVDVIIIRIGFC